MHIGVLGTLQVTQWEAGVLLSLLMTLRMEVLEVPALSFGGTAEILECENVERGDSGGYDTGVRYG